MKKILSVLCLSLMATVAMAQDILVTESGEAIKAWDVDVAGQKIYYRASADANAPTLSIKKSDVLMWKKADGTRQLIGQDGTSAATPAAAAPSAPAQSAPT